MIEARVNTKEVDIKLKNAESDFRKGCMDGLRKGGQIVRRRIQKLIKDPPKTGKKYPNLPFRSSASGEAPAFQTGKLFRGVQYKVWRWNKMEVGDTVIYGKFLEYGTEFLKPRPHISTAATDTFQAVKIALEIAIDRRMSN